jgi:hypothetical protein
MSVSNEFKMSIKKWVELDEKQKKIREVSTKLKKDKDKYQEYILDYMSSNNIKDKNILINDGKLCYGESKTSQTISKKYIIEKLTTYFKNETKAEEIANLLYDNREIKKKSFLKRMKK